MKSKWRSSEAALQAAHDAVIVHQERQRLARELHDALTQSIYSIALFARAGGDALEHSEQDKARQIGARVELTLSETDVLQLDRIQLADLTPDRFDIWAVIS